MGEVSRDDDGYGVEDGTIDILRGSIKITSMSS